MWLVAKIKVKEIDIFKKSLNKKIGDKVRFYLPKFLYKKKIRDKYVKYDKAILENYIFCYHEKFREENFVLKNRFLRGLQYFLNGSQSDQREIKNFIDHCKSHEDSDGYLSASFFKEFINDQAKFITGPLTNMMFKILSKQKNKLTILIGSITTTISDKNNYIYRSV